MFLVGFYVKPVPAKRYGLSFARKINATFNVRFGPMHSSSFEIESTGGNKPTNKSINSDDQSLRKQCNVGSTTAPAPSRPGV